MSTTTIHEEGELVAGQMMGRYELLMPIATGGMGTVWAARLKGTRGFRKLVAIKTVLPSAENIEPEQGLLREATLASQIHHPNVAETLELGEQDGMLYLVMELVSGESLGFILREAQKKGGVPFPVAINLVGQICRGLAAAHDVRDEDGNRVGLIHRDISPPNVLVTDSGTVKIVDFGVATTSSSATYASGEIKGKISYLAPEQLRGEPLDERVDIFTTGILLYLLTVGRHPFRAASEATTVARILSDVPAAPPSSLVEDYPEALESVVVRALDKCRDTRFPSALAMLEALQRAWPDAFGPRADAAVCAYVRELTKQRAAERRATLRMAEELSEQSGGRHSVRSMAAVVTSTPLPSRRPRRVSRAAVMGFWLTLGTAAAAVPTYWNLMQSSVRSPVEAKQQAGLGDPTASPPPAEPAARTIPVAATAAAPSPMPAVAQSVAESSVRSLADSSVSEPSAVARTEAGRPHRAESAPSDESRAASSDASEPGPSRAHRETAEPTALPAVLPPALPQIEPATATTAVVAALAPSRLEPAAPPAERTVPSRVGHGLLRINPNADAYRVRPPRALERHGVAFQATVKICVGADGGVSNVSVLRSAGSAIDPQIREVLSRWRYRPLLQGGQKTPFCYTLAYEIRP